MHFQNRTDAGQQLAQKLLKYRHDSSAIVIGLPRGGVVVAAEIAKELRLPLDIVVPRKIGAPENPEFALGAISEEGDFVYQPGLIEALGVPDEYLTMTVLKEKNEAQRRLTTYRGDKAPLRLQNKIALVIDDGVATGATMRAAILSCREKGAGRVVAVAPVIAPDTLKILQKEADEVVYVSAPEYFSAVGQFYRSFEQTSDAEVSDLLRSYSVDS